MTTPRIYVGTYAKYNSGSIAGAWLDLEDYSDKDSFLEACAKVHADEEDPEYMFQDFEGFPKSYYSESSIPEELWDWLDLDDSDREMVEAYREGVEADADTDHIRDQFAGRGYDTEADWAAEWLEDTGGLEGVPDHLRNYIDYEAYARDARLGGDMVFVRHAGELFVFHNG